MSADRTCPECGEAIAPGATDGLCAQCLFSLGLEAPETPAPSPPPDLGPLVARPAPAIGVKFHYFGDYELLEEIARGGMGIVFKARQISLNRLVALKLISAGTLATEELVKRFQAEAEAAASLSHPNIVPIYEIGEQEGQHYFSMGLIEGPNLRAEIANRKSEIANSKWAARLLSTIARAVHYAHQRGVLHRDIKPSNILLDSAGEPQLTDFGLAKLIEKESTLTHTNAVLGTPAYMSPEQARGHSKDVTTAADVYGLGAVFYETLTGAAPFGAGTSMETIRQVLDEEPRRPSILNAAVDCDLETICLKCLEKEPGRRYRSAEALADDLDRWVRSEPITARPVSNSQRLRKWMHRRPAVAALGSLSLILLLALAIGSPIAAWRIDHARQQAQAAQANAETERRKAQTEAAKSDQVARFLKDMLKGVGPSVAQGRDTTMLREILAKTAKRVGKELSNQPEVQIELLHSITLTYSELGLSEQMEQTASEALRLARKHLGELHVTTTRQLELLATAQWKLGRPDEAETAQRRVLAIRRQILGDEHFEVGGALNSLGQQLDSRGKFAEAAQMFAEALALGRKTYRKEHPSIATALANLGTALRHQGKLTEAEARYREALAIDRKLLGTNHPSIASSVNSLAAVLNQQGKLVEAEALFREVVALRRKVLGDEHPDTVTSLCNLASTLGSHDKLEEAETTYEEAFKTLRKPPVNDRRLTVALNGIAFVYRKQGRLDEAEGSLREALAIGLRALGAEHPSVGATFENLAGLLRSRGKSGEAATLCRDRLLALRGRVPSDDPELAYAVVQLAVLLNEEEKFTEAEPLAVEGLSIREGKLPDDWRTFHTRRVLGSSLMGQKRYAEAEPLLVSGYEGMNQRQAEIPMEKRRYIKEALQSLVQLYESTTRPGQAGEWRKKLEEIENGKTDQPTASPAAKAPPSQ